MAHRRPGPDPQWVAEQVAHFTARYHPAQAAAPPAATPPKPLYTLHYYGSSRNAAVTYTVSLPTPDAPPTAGPRCTCPGYKYYAGCKHIRAAQGHS